MNERVHKMCDAALIGLFVVLIFTPLAGLFLRLDLRNGAEDEKREPAPLPHLASVDDLRSFPRKFDAYFQDHFGFRRLLIRGHSLMSYFVFHVSPSPKVILGKEGWLMYDGQPANDGDPIDEFRGHPQLTPFQLERWRWMLQDVNDWLHERGIRFLVVLVPAKESVYPEYMPDFLQPVGESANIVAARYLEQRGLFEFLDLRPALVAAKGEQSLYRRTDTHWNPYGAYLGYCEIMNRLAAWYPALQPWPLSEFDVKRETYFAGDLAQMMDLRRVLSDELVTLAPHKPRRAQIQQSGDKALPDMIAQIDDPTLPRAVFFRDSFTEDLVPYLSEHFSRAFYKWARVGLELRTIEEEKPDIVIHIMGDRFLGRGLRYPTKMQVRGAERRFDSSTNVLARVTDVWPVKDATAETRDDGIIVHARGFEPTVELPAIADAKRYMPIVRLEISAPAKTVARIAWDSNVPSTMKMEINADLDRGTNTVYLPLMDPEMTGAPRLNVGTQKGDYLIKSIEIRGYPR